MQLKSKILISIARQLNSADRNLLSYLCLKKLHLLSPVGKLNFFLLSCGCSKTTIITYRKTVIAIPAVTSLACLIAFTASVLGNIPNLHYLALAIMTGFAVQIATAGLWTIIYKPLSQRAPV